MCLPRGVGVLAIGLTAALLAACVTAYGQGQQALREGRYSEAAGRFEEVLAREPGRLDALIGLGVSRYNEGLNDDAIASLGQAVTRAPGDETAQLYLALAYLRKGEVGPTEEHLTKLKALAPAPRVAAQIDRTLALLREEAPLTEPMRAFVAASLEEQVAAAREVQEARRARHYYAVPPPFYRDCFLTRRNRIVCF
jgi:tetratricopeptide (TPR) repeat protein